MKPSALAILWLARLAEVGYRSIPKEPRLQDQGPSLVNQTCSCQCLCSPGHSRTLDLSLGLVVGVLLASVVFSVCRLSSSRGQAAEGDESFVSPRRRGGGVVQVPSRTAGYCVVC